MDVAKDKDLRIERAVLIYIRTRKERVSPSELQAGIGAGYIIVPDKPNCYCRYKVVRPDIVRILKGLSVKGQAEFVGGRQWGLTEVGKKQADIYIETCTPMITRLPKLLYRRLLKRGYKPVSMEDMKEIATVSPGNMGRYGIGVKLTDRAVIIMNAKCWIVYVDKLFFKNDTTVPDFSDAEIIDCGNTLRLGTYEAALDKLFGPVSM